jgi:CHASE3 domain sensor protein
MSAESITLTVLASLALGLLVLVTGGVAFLTTMEWRDRRRQDQEKREMRRRK